MRDEEAPGGVIARGDALVVAVPEECMAAAAAKDIPVDYQEKLNWSEALWGSCCCFESQFD